MDMIEELETAIDNSFLEKELGIVNLLILKASREIEESLKKIQGRQKD